ncbi:WAT1-related protein At3g28050-like [Abrus precatorius]|uniref:WAT1-related protein n=1 Tax=Abrus precatorius TaxID=3816 RepID=A0A8B8MJC6_ABRPR|nr:WAT1-related protein At3g28050-like [Abrus precatorius]
MELRRYLLEWSPFIAMVIVECLDVGLSTLSKAAMSRGMNHFVFVVYSNALATLILLPSSFIINRTPPPLCFSLLCKFFLLGFLGITVMQNCVFTGINYSSPTLGSAMSNLTPAVTFLLAVILRMEKLNIGSSISQIKVMGTVLSISGALLVTLYKGSPIITFQIQPSPLKPLPSLLVKTSNWAIGGLFLAAASLSLAGWNILQATVLKGYSSQLTIVAFYCLFGTIQCATFSLIVVGDPNAWNLRPDIELIAILYSAIFGSVVTFSVLTWCIKRKGPVFVTMFKPVGIAIAAFMSVIFLGETLHVGSVIGALVIAIGLYAVLWAQSKERNKEGFEVDRLPSLSTQASPLLESRESND